MESQRRRYIAASASWERLIKCGEVRDELHSVTE